MPQLVSELPVGSSILGFSMVGTSSHQMLLLKIGQELITRGHTFSLLVSAYDAMSLQVVFGVSHIQVLTFQGPLYAGTEEWAARLPQDPQEV